jgi:cysteine desulfurase/selenocysteine lyase
MFDYSKIRLDFPILKTGIVYLDNAASSLTPEPVLEKMLEFYHNYRANVERGVHKLSQKASEEYDDAHRNIANFINAESEDEVIFTKNTTESINIIANGLDWKRGDKIVTSLIEHHSNFIVWLRLREKFGVEVEIVRPDYNGVFDLGSFEDVIDDRTKLVALTHVSNGLGVITPVEQVAKIAHDHNALFLVDGAQSVPHMKVDVQDVGCDFLAFSGHKMLGPTGIGVLYLKKNAMERVAPLCIGGGTISKVTSKYYKLTGGSGKFEAGTPAIAEAIGLSGAVDYLERIGFQDIGSYERGLARKMCSGLRQIAKVEVYGPNDDEKRIGIAPFNIDKMSPHDVALALDASVNIMVRSGHHCAMPLMSELLKKPEGCVRASLYIYNTENEIEKLLSAVEGLASS